jgi:hypothetical protein
MKQVQSLLLDVQGQVTPACSKSHITYKFHWNKAGGKMVIHFAYEPKNLEDAELSKSLIYESIDKFRAPGGRDIVQAEWKSFLPLKNLITISVDDPKRHRGAGHRHDPEQLLHIAANDASPGLISGILPLGMWEVTLSLHAIVTEQCLYSLKIWREEE